MPDIIALGEPLIEFVALERGRLGQVATFRRGWGGDTCNFIVAAARLGASTGYITRVGGDEFGQSLLALWKQEGIDASSVIAEPGGATGIVFTALAEDGTHEFTYYRAGSAASRLQASDIDPEYLARAKIFHTSGITHAISPSAAAAADAAIVLARQQHLTISYDANVRPKLRELSSLRATFEAVINSVHVVFLSTEDASHLYGPVPATTVVARVLAYGPQVVVLKQGEAGCLVGLADGAQLQVAGWPVEAVDATGAGDAFDAAFLVERARGTPLDEACRFANAVGALTATGLGAVSAIPTRAHVKQFMAEHASQRGVER